jgi:hypothetical protein
MTEKSESGGRRVMQCACERAAAWRGVQAAVDLGWRWSGHAWVCPDCYRPQDAARPALEPLPLFLRDLILYGPDALALEQLAMLKAEAPARFAAALHDIREILAMSFWCARARRKRWRTWERWVSAEERALTPKPAGSRSRRRAPPR